MKLARYLLLLSSTLSSVPVKSESSAQEHRLPVDDGWVDDDELHDLPVYSTLAKTQTTRCCEQGDDVNLIVISTMDGKVHALDVDEGTLVWQSDLDGAALLGGNLGKMQPMYVDDEVFTLVPSLDGSLYMFTSEQRLLEPIPLTTDMLLQSVKIGNEAIAGGKTISTTGIDPITGKIRYHCTSSLCEQATAREEALSTLVFRRTSHSIRAVDALSGTEKWNLSVSEYDASLVRKRTATEGNIAPRNANFVISPPTGTVTALNPRGSAIWSVTLGAHVARSWLLSGHQLNEISIFDSNIHTMKAFEPKSVVTRPESLFYVGTIEGEPFILCSDKVRGEMGRMAKQLELSAKIDQSSKKPSTALAVKSSHQYQIETGTLEEVLGRAFKQSVSQSRRKDVERERRAITASDPDSPDLTVAIPSSGMSESSCSQHAGMMLIGEENIRSADPSGSDTGDQGFFVLRPQSSGRQVVQPFGPFKPGVCGEMVRKSLRLDEDVNPLWRLLAIVLLLVTGVLSMFKYLKWNRRNSRITHDTPLKELSEDSPLLEEQALVGLTQLSVSTPLPATDHSNPAPVRHTVSDEIAKKQVRTETAEPDNESLLARSRTLSSKSQGSGDFSSKFLDDFEPIQVLGKGGFGVVFEAQNKLDEHHYAVKRIAVGNNDRDIKRVLREVRAMALLEHTGIIRYYHTWIEQAPKAQLDEVDKEVQRRLHIVRKLSRLEEMLEMEESDTTESTQSSLPSEKEERKNVLRSNSIDAPPLPDESGETSWMEESCKKNGKELQEEEASASSSSSSSDDDDDGEQIVDELLPMKKEEEQSESIVFDRSKGSGNRSSLSAITNNSSELSKLITDVVIVTSVDNKEWLPCKAAEAEYAYLYIQMQLCSKTLYHWLLENRTAESRDVGKMKEWMRELVSATNYLHKRALVHRDIKPQNVFLSEEGTLKIGDLGLVSKTGEDMDPEAEDAREAVKAVQHTDNVGTRSYMSPEQLANLPYTSKVDVFSLGLIYTEMCIPFTTLMHRAKVLRGLQKGEQPEELAEDDQTAEFIAWLTNVQPDRRPTCEVILACDYLKP